MRCKHKWNLQIHVDGTTIWMCEHCHCAKSRAFTNDIRVTKFFRYGLGIPYYTQLKDMKSKEVVHG